MAVTAEEPTRVQDKDECLHISLRRSVFYNCCLMNDILGSHSQVHILCLFTLLCTRSDVRLSLGQFVTTGECLHDRTSSA